MIKQYDKYRVLKQGPDLWFIIEPTRNQYLRNQNSCLLTFKTKLEALKYCDDNNLEVGEEYL